MANFRRNRGSSSPSRKRQAVKVLASEVAATRAQLSALLTMSKDCPAALAGPIKDVELKRQLPSADAIVMSEMTLPNQHAYLMVLRTMAQRMMAAMAPRVIWKLAKKMEDHKEPGDTRLIAEYLKGMGFLEPGTPLNDDEREAKMKKHAEFETMTLEQLKAAVAAGRD